LNRTRPASLSASPPRQVVSAPLLQAGRAELLDRLQEMLAYRFGNLDLLELAVTHSSVAYEEQAERSAEDDNERLEFLGDAVLGMIVTEHLFRACPELTEGPLTRLRAQLVSRQYLGQVGHSMSLGEYLRLGKGEEKSGGRRKSAILANAVEAVLAALYLDGGMEPATRFVRDWLLRDKLDVLVSAARAGEDVGDYKSALQEYFQAHGLGQPHYAVTAEAGPDHRKSFVVAVKRVVPTGLEDTLASATGTRKKSAEQEAARLALQVLQMAATEAAGKSA
jgi:ribonuclease-3